MYITHLGYFCQNYSFKDIVWPYKSQAIRLLNIDCDSSSKSPIRRAESTTPRIDNTVCVCVSVPSLGALLNKRLKDTSLVRFDYTVQEPGRFCAFV
jgi:hypothetical protein